MEESGVGIGLPKIGKPYKEPEPNNSLNTATRINNPAYPRAFPKPSITEGQGLFAIAKASKRSHDYTIGNNQSDENR